MMYVEIRLIGRWMFDSYTVTQPFYVCMPHVNGVLYRRVF